MKNDTEISQLLNSFNDAIFLLNKDGLILFVNHRAESKFNIEQSIINSYFDDFIHFTDLVTGEPVDWKCVEGNEGELKAVCRSGKRAFIAEVDRRHISIKGAECMIVIKDVTLREQLESSLSKSKQELQLLYSMLVEAQEVERQKIATELHDQIGQFLVRLKLDLQWLKRHLNDSAEIIGGRVDLTLSILNETVKQVKQLTYSLKPQLLEQFGLKAGVLALSEYFKGDSGVDVKINIRMSDDELDKDKTLDVYRIVQQAVTNAIEHGKPSEVVVSLQITKSQTIVIEVVDNGIGFDYDESMPTGLGIAGMQERVFRWNGKFDLFRNKKYSGTTLKAEIPL